MWWFSYFTSILYFITRIELKLRLILRIWAESVLIYSTYQFSPIFFLRIFNSKVTNISYVLLFAKFYPVYLKFEPVYLDAFFFNLHF